MTPQELIGLRAAVEQRFGGVISVQSDFDKLSVELKSKLSSTTLKRVWGYNKDHQSISKKTTNILAEYLGFSSYEEFLKVGVLDSDDHKVLHNASQIAMLAGRIHSERGESACELLMQCRYREALTLLSDIDEDVAVFKNTSEAFFDSAYTIIAEVNLKATSIWSCNYEWESCIEAIDKLFEDILPLANAVNDHFLLWIIYTNWASWTRQSGDVENAMNLQKIAINQGRILQLEDPDEPPIQLQSSLADMAMMLSDLERYKESDAMISEALELKGDKIVEAFLWFNHARNCLELERWQDNLAFYEKVLDLLSEWNNMNVAVNESVCLEAVTYHNLAILHQDFLEPNDSIKAIEYFEKAIELFECRNVPNLAYRQYHQYAIQQLKILRDMTFSSN